MFMRIHKEVDIEQCYIMMTFFSLSALKTLGEADRLPRLTVQSDDLQRVTPLLNAVSIGDERGVSARLEALEISMQKNQ